MKTLLAILSIFFAVISTGEAQNAALNAANNSVFRAISPSSTNSSTTVYDNTVNISNTFNAVDIKVSNFEFITTKEFYNSTIYDRLISNPAIGIQNNPNQLLFRKNSIQNLNYVIRNY